MQNFDITQKEEIYTVSRLNNEVRFLLEDTLPLIWIEGEISNFSAPHSGHWYFCLKDAAAQVNCAMFRGSQRKLNFTPKDGNHVLLKARVSLYENTGRFQLIAEDMEERGEGKLRRAFEALKKKLEAAGLFDAVHKKPLPSFPNQIGVITSATGAAIRDILIVLKRRYASVPVIIYPTLVQGETAAANIVKALEIANQRNECDLLILARGGGSLEDLWPFNEEIVAHAIFNSQLPIISGIGHEIDFTIADFVADQRAPTPSAAAEMATPDSTELMQTISRNQQYLLRQMQHVLNRIKQQLLWLHKHLSHQHPKRRLLEKMQQLDFFELTFIQLETRSLTKLQTRLKDLDIRLHRLIPLKQIHSLQHQLHFYQHQLTNLMLSKRNHYQSQLAHIAAKLDALSPLATLKRGYAIASDKNQHILNNIHQINPGDQIDVRLTNGTLMCKVEDIKYQ